MILALAAIILQWVAIGAIARRISTLVTQRDIARADLADANGTIALIQGRYATLNPLIDALRAEKADLADKLAASQTIYRMTMVQQQEIAARLATAEAKLRRNTPRAANGRFAAKIGHAA